jgi:uncharacterized membrane protein
MEELFNFFIVLVVYLLLDLPMITFINKDMYKNLFESINNGATVDSTNIIIGAIVAYLLLAYGLYIFAIKNKSIFNGALFGLVVYGVYNFTNLAVIAKYGLIPAVIDTIWGTILCGMITSAVLHIKNYII